MALWQILLCALVVACSATKELDFQNEIAQRAPFQSQDFIFAFDGPPTPPNAPGGRLVAENLAANPVLATLQGSGGSQAKVTVNGCGVILPHFHPRGTEFAHILEGQIDFHFLEENQQRLLGGRVHKGQTIFLPAGTVHFAVNPLCEPMSFLASFDHRDPGATFLNQQLFAGLVPDNVITAATDLKKDAINRVRAFNKDRGLNPGLDQECAKRCGWGTRAASEYEGAYTEALPRGVWP